MVEMKIRIAPEEKLSVRAPSNRSNRTPPSSLQVASVQPDLDVADSVFSSSAFSTATTTPKHQGIGENPAAAATLASTDFDYPHHDPHRQCISKSVPPPPFMKERIGRMYVLAELPCNSFTNDPVRCVVGPCWPMLFVSLTLVLGLSLAAFVSFLPGLPVVMTVLASMVLIVNVVGLMLTGCSDPGIQPRYDQPQGDDWTWSDKAQSYRPPGAIYEIETQVLVKDIDHFCPWVGNLVAGGNLRYFNLFTRSLWLLICVTVVVVVWGLAISSEYELA
jgi:hypothetical protein